MKIDGFKQYKSSFLSMEKDMAILMNAMLNNERLKRLLYYTTNDALDKPNLTEEQSISLIGTNIKNVPKLVLDKSVLNYIIVSFDNFLETENPEFRDNIIEFDIIGHMDQWPLKDFALRPFKIAAEIDTIFNNKKFTGMGKLEFLGCKIVGINNEFAGVALLYGTVHGGEDRVNQPNPQNEERAYEDFKSFINAK